MLSTPHRWDGDFPLAGHLSVNGGCLVLYLLFGLLGYTLWRVRRQQKLFDILFCQVSRRLPETVTNATHFVEERFWIIGITLIDVFAVSAKLVIHSHAPFNYELDPFVETVFKKVHYLRLGSSLFLVALFLMMFYESINTRNFIFRPFLFNTILIFVSVVLVLPIIVLEILLKMYEQYGEGLFIVQLLWMLMLVTMMMAIVGHIAINAEESDQEGLSVRNVNTLNASDKNLQASKNFMVAVVVVQTVFEILLTIWNMVNAYYVQMNVKPIGDVDQRATWNAIADSIYIVVPCLIKCITYVIVFRQVPVEPAASQALTMRSLPSRSDNPYGDPNENPYGSRAGDNPYGSRSMNTTFGSRGGISGENPYGSRSENAYGSVSLNPYGSVNGGVNGLSTPRGGFRTPREGRHRGGRSVSAVSATGGVNGAGARPARSVGNVNFAANENPYEAWYRANTLAPPRNTVFDASASSRRDSLNRFESENDLNDYQNEVYTLSIQKIPRPPP